MIIGVSEKTLWAQINKQWESIDSEVRWLSHYITTGEVECMEDCVQNVMDSCKAIMEDIENLRGEEL